MKYIQKHYQFIESIYWKDKEMPLLPWHERRFKETQMAHFGLIIYPSLKKIIEKNIPTDYDIFQVYKVRVVYSEKFIGIEFQPYQKKKIEKLYLVENNTIDYSYKYLNRTDLEKMKLPFQTNEEIIIVKEGLLTDTTFTNIALHNGKRWETPATPLFEGTQRSFLLEQNIIFPVDICVTDLNQYSRIRLFNAMVDWDEAWELPITDLQL